MHTFSVLIAFWFSWPISREKASLFTFLPVWLASALFYLNQRDCLYFNQSVVAGMKLHPWVSCQPAASCFFFFQRVIPDEPSSMCENWDQDSWGSTQWPWPTSHFVGGGGRSHGQKASLQLNDVCRKNSMNYFDYIINRKFSHQVIVVCFWRMKVLTKWLHLINN